MKKIITMLFMAGFVVSMLTIGCHHKNINEPINTGNDSIIPKDTLPIPAPTPTLITHP